MEKIIRKAVLATERTALSSRSDDQCAVLNLQLAPPEGGGADIDRIRADIEASLRKELAEEAIAAFEAEHSRGRVEGFSKGHEEGVTLAKKEAEAAQVALRTAIESSLTSISGAVEEHKTLINSELSSLVLVCLVRILGQSAPTAQSIEHMVSNVLVSAHAAGRVRIRIHPNDLKVLTDVCDPHGLTTAAQAIELVADSSLVGGGCIAETSVGQFDASIDSQLRILHACMQESRHRAASEAVTSELIS